MYVILGGADIVAFKGILSIQVGPVDGYNPRLLVTRLVFWKQFFLRKALLPLITFVVLRK